MSQIQNMEEKTDSIIETMRVKFLREIISYEAVRLTFDEVCKIVEVSEEKGTGIFSHIEKTSSHVSATLFLNVKSLSNKTLLALGEEKVRSQWGIPAIHLSMEKGFLCLSLGSKVNNSKGKRIDINGKVISD
jgi:hypothetical protein